MKCPVCNSDGAYVGLSVVECLNTDCRHFRQIEVDVADLQRQLAGTPCDSETILTTSPVHWRGYQSSIPLRGRPTLCIIFDECQEINMGIAKELMIPASMIFGNNVS